MDIRKRLGLRGHSSNVPKIVLRLGIGAVAVVTVAGVVMLVANAKKKPAK